MGSVSCRLDKGVVGGAGQDGTGQRVLCCLIGSKVEAG